MGRGKKKFPKDPHENKPIYFDRKILKSKAYWNLTGLGPQYLMFFLSRRQMQEIKAEKRWEQRNNGDIVFTYSDAEKWFGVLSGRHRNTLRKLLEVGFIDINHQGGGMDGDCSTFYISRRWEKYGTPDFIKKEWPKDMRRKGNPKIKNYGKGRNG